MWKFNQDTENSLEFTKDGEIKLQLIKEDSLSEEDFTFGEKVVEALNKCGV